MLYSDINNINNIEYSEQNISRMDKWYINDQRKQTQHNIILVFNKLKQEQICTAHTRCNENQNCRQFQCFIYMQQYVWFLLLIYQSFYPLQFVASFKQVAWVWMLDPFSRTVGRAGLKHYKYNVIPTHVLSKRQYYSNSVNNKWFFRRKWFICH